MPVSGGRVASGVGTGAAVGTSILPGWGTAIGAAVGGIAGALSGDGGAAATEEAIKQGLAELEAMGIPPDLSGPIIYKELQKGGQLTPEMEGQVQEALFNPSSVQDNAQTRAQLTGALANIQAKAFGGLSPEQMANQQKLLQQVDANTQAQFKGILQGQAARGQSGSGDTLASMLSAAQGGAQQGSQNALQIGAQGSQMQNQAMKDYLAGITSLRGADDTRNTSNAQLQQQANMYKAQNAQSRAARSVNAANTAQQYNLSRENYANDYNTNVQNQELLRQQNAKRQAYIDHMNAVNGKLAAQSGYGGQMANNSNQAFNNTMQGIGTIGSAIGQYKNSGGFNSGGDDDDGWTGFTADRSAGSY